MPKVCIYSASAFALLNGSICGQGDEKFFVAKNKRFSFTFKIFYKEMIGSHQDFSGIYALRLILEV